MNSQAAFWRVGSGVSMIMTEPTPGVRPVAEGIGSGLATILKRPSVWRSKLRRLKLATGMKPSLPATNTWRA